MSDALARIDPVPMEVVHFSGGTLALSPIAKRYSLRGAAADVQACTKAKLPTKIGAATDNSEGMAAMLGPDEWLLLGATTGTSAAASITEITERQIGITLNGPRAAEVLMSGCPLDLEHMPVGRGTRTIYETIEVILIKRGADQFHIEVWRSFAPWLWAALIAGAT